MPEPFVITRAVHGEIVVLALAGFLDAHTAPRFETAVQSEIDAGHHRLVVDATALSYISSAGLGVFMGFIEEVREAGGDIKIAALAPKVREVFNLLGFDAIFDLVDDVPAAVERFTATPSA
ncbi:MAG: STAS domain-containing protein [Acidobacteria bacterium]|nr:STAS domain-containing protein [Acidobacteriota bacterium]